MLLELVHLMHINLSRITQDIFWTLHANGFISSEKVCQLVCETCNRFLVIYIYIYMYVCMLLWQYTYCVKLNCH